MLSGDCRGLERDRQGQSGPKKGGELRGEGPAWCHRGLVSSLPQFAVWCPSTILQWVPGTSLFHQESKHSKYTVLLRRQKGFFFPSSIKSADFFFLSLRAEELKYNSSREIKTKKLHSLTLKKGPKTLEFLDKTCLILLSSEGLLLGARHAFF